jgi:hypothetical protein
MQTLDEQTPNAPMCDDERSETFTHMEGWAENADLAACFLSRERRNGSANRQHTSDKTERKA